MDLLRVGEHEDLTVADAADPRDRRGKENLTAADVWWTAETRLRGYWPEWAWSNRWRLCHLPVGTRQPFGSPKSIGFAALAESCRKGTEAVQSPHESTGHARNGQEAERSRRGRVDRHPRKSSRRRLQRYLEKAASLRQTLDSRYHDPRSAG